ncbi:MAG: hypothetical protein CMD19_00955 [Flavobacteriales bacterium]|nr:hypothetical protein [Flavobacteriales bacterium]
MEEIHLFIIWSKGIGQKDRILKDISSKFTICSIYNTTWSKNRFSNNLSRFYGENLPKNSKKEKHCGADTFCCIIVKDNKPQYELRETSKGVRVVNINLFDAKQLYRSWTSGNKIHATDNIEETKLQLALLYGKDYHEYLSQDTFDQNALDYRNDLIGANGWNSFDELFHILNLTLNYIVLRNFDNLEDQLTTKHPDVDILTENKNLTKDILNAVETTDKSYRVQHSVKINNKDINFDIRYVGDNYYDKSWEIELLKTKVKHEKGFYIPDNLNLFYSLIYHALVHKQYISEDYIKQFLILSKRLNLSLKKCNLIDTVLLDILLSYMFEYNYNIVEPNDLSVFFNERLINKRIYIPVSTKRTKYKAYLNLRSLLKKILIKILKKLRLA